MKDSSISQILARSLAAAAFVCAATCAGVEWKGLSEENWYSGRKLRPADLNGKVVMVDEWGVRCPPCRALLPRMEEIWKSFKSKPFVLIGSHRQGRQPEAVAELVKQNKLTYPIYDRAGIVDEPSNGGGIPFIYVVDANGKVVYSGRSDREAIAAVVNAFDTVPDRSSLIGGVELVKFKSMRSQLVFGKSCESALRQLKSAAAKGSDAKAKEAASIVAAIEETHNALKAEIDDNVESRPAATLDAMNRFCRTWPSEAKEYTAKLKALSSDSDVAKCGKIRAVLEKYRNFEPKTPNAAKRALAEVKGAIASAKAMEGCRNTAAAGEAQVYAGELAECEKELEAAAAPRRK